MLIRRLCLNFYFPRSEAEPLDMGSQAGAWEPVNQLSEPFDYAQGTEM
jgi:hypothetical protein